MTRGRDAPNSRPTPYNQKLQSRIWFAFMSIRHFYRVVCYTHCFTVPEFKLFNCSSCEVESILLFSTIEFRVPFEGLSSPSLGLWPRTPTDVTVSHRKNYQSNPVCVPKREPNHGSINWRFGFGATFMCEFSAAAAGVAVTGLSFSVTSSVASRATRRRSSSPFLSRASTTNSACSV